MAELRLEPDEMKKLIKMGKQRPLPFAFSPGGEQPDLLLFHRKKAPEKLAKKARKETGATRVAYGTFAVTGQEMKLTCLRLMPQLDKRVKKVLREMRISLSVTLLDADGKEPTG
ncbi:MAG: hypothetical protein V4804_03175 [Pseudomonadota bacterium]